MQIIAGYIFMLVCVIGAYVAHGGSIMAILAPLPSEGTIIFGGALGASFVANGPKLSKQMASGLGGLFKPSKYTKQFYIELLLLLYVILAKMRKDGPFSIEAHVEGPHESHLFANFPRVLADHHAVDFMTDYLRLILMGNLGAMEIESLMDVEIDTHHKEAEAPGKAVANLADSLPAFGIVAAVMGVVVTMGAIATSTPAQLGANVASALVGTFLGIWLGYGFVGPLAVFMEREAEKGGKAFEIIKVTLLATVNSYPPQIAIEFGRKALYASDRPSFREFEEHVKGAL